jgi:hypothetical protein
MADKYVLGEREEEYVLGEREEEYVLGEREEEYVLGEREEEYVLGEREEEYVLGEREVDDSLSAAEEEYVLGEREVDENLPEYIQNREGEYEGFFTELGEGVVSGGIGIGQGIAELGASAFDLVADTDYASSITQSADDLRDRLGVDPEGIAGAIGEIGVQFVLPGMAAVGAVSKLSKLGRIARASKAKPNLIGMSRSQKLGLLAQQSAAAGLTDAVVATDNIRTISDFFDGGPLTTDQAIGLTGRDEAARRLLNKLKIGTEGMAAAAALPFAVGKAVSTTGKVLGATGKVVASTGAAQSVGKVAVAAGEKVGKKMADIEARIMDPTGSVSSFENFAYTVRASLSPRGNLPQEVAEEMSFIPGMTEAQVRVVGQRFARFDKELNKFEKSLPKARLSEFHRQEMYDTLFEYLSTGTASVLNRLPQGAQKPASLMRSQVNDLGTDIKNSNILNQMDEITPAKGQPSADQIRNLIDTNMDSYLRRRYRMFTDASYKPDAQTLEVGRQGFLSNPRETLRELKFIIERGGEEAASKARALLNPEESALLSTTVTPEAAEQAMEGFLRRHSPKARMETEVKTVAKDRLNVSLLNDRKQMQEFERRLLGEVKDAREAVLGTVSDLAGFRAIDQFHGKVARLAQEDKGIGKYFVSPDKVAPQGYATLSGKEFGVLEGYRVPQRMAKDLTRQAVGQEEGLSMAMRATYGSFLKMKGLSQFAKTVLSPITQIRNVTTASAFALAQGNVGRGANLGESLHIVLKDIAKEGDEALMKELVELQDLGVIGAQAQLKELQELITKGMSRRDATTVEGIEVGAEFGNILRQGTLGDFYNSAAKKIRPVTDKLTDFYQGGDNVWKIYNYKFEQSKLSNALRGMELPDQIKTLNTLGARLADDASEEMVERAIRDQSADIVRNVVPNYNKAPEFIRSLRKAPVGNFVAFPYEIYRTGFNTIERGLKELSSESAAIREIGLRRLTGAATTFAALPAGVSALGYGLTDVTEEEMAAYKRSGAPSWERNSRLVPTGRNDKGQPTYVNYSYSNPYDLLERSIQTVLNEVEIGRQMEYDVGRVVFNAGSQAMLESMSSFIGPAIMTNKVLDISPTAAAGRGGRTETGARVYNPEDSAGDKMAKSFVHVLDGIMPSASPFQVRSGKLEAGRFLRGVTTSIGINEALGIAPEDRQGRDYELGNELMRAFTGITELTVDPARNLGYKGFEFTRARTNASNIFNREANASNATSESLLDAYVKADNARYRVYNEFYSTVRDFRTMGMSDREIRKVLKESKVGDINSIMRNRYKPLSPSEQIKKNMRRVGSFSEYPRLEIRRIQRERRNMEFSSPEPAEDDFSRVFQPIENVEEKRPLSSPRMSAAVPMPAATGPEASFDVSGLAETYAYPGTGNIVMNNISRNSILASAKKFGQTPQQLIETTGLQPVTPDASLLGDDPVSIARNMEIAQRTRRG